MTEETYEYKGVLAGSDPIYTTECMLEEDWGVLPALTPMGQVKATGLWVQANDTETDGSENATRMTLKELDTDAFGGAKPVQLAKSGTFDIDQVAFRRNDLTDAVKWCHFAGTAISLQTAG